MKQYAFLLAGSICMAVGIVGVIIPVLPTTPLLLLAAYCFARSSKRLHDWLVYHPFFGLYIREYLEHRAVSKKSKTWALIILWVSLIISMLIVKILFVRILLTIIGIAVTVHILKLKTLSKEMIKEKI